MEQHNFKKQFGQNFLTNVEWIFAFIEAANLSEDDTVVEVGPGDGAITNYLIQTVNKLFAIEIDFELVAHLREIFEEHKNFKVVQADIMELNIDKLIGDEKYKVVGALPYNISKQIIKKFFEQKNKPESMTFILQNEVAVKYTAKPPKATFLSNYARLHSEANYIAKIPNVDFYPVPAVDGGIIHFNHIDKVASPSLKKFIKLGFSQPRKKLSKNLSNYNYSKESVESELTAMGLSTAARAGELTIENWSQLLSNLKSENE